MGGKAGGIEVPVATVVAVCVPILVGGGALADKIGGLLVAKEDADTVALVAKVSLRLQRRERQEQLPMETKTLSDVVDVVVVC